MWREAPAAEEHADGEHQQSEHEDAEGATDFVSLAPSAASAAGVEIATVARGGGSELLLPGRVVFAPNAESVIASPLSGVVETVHVAVGSQVGAGSALATIRSPDGASLRASADAAAADAEAARAAFRRETRLYDERVTARQDFEAARAAAAKAEAGLRATQAQLAAAGSPSASGRTIVRTRIGGTVTQIGTAPGAFATQGGTIAQVADQGRIELIFDAPAAVSRALRPGTAIFARGAGGEEVRAVVAAVSPNAQNAGAQVRARAMGYAPPVGTPLSGRALTAAGGYLSVPSDAVQTVEGRPVVFVVERAGFRARPVVPGRVAGGRTEVLRGLSEGERVAGRGAFLLKAELSKGEAGHEH